MTAQLASDTRDESAATPRRRRVAPRGLSFARSLLSAVPVMLVGSLALSPGVVSGDRTERDRERPTPAPEPGTGAGAAGTLDFAAATPAPAPAATYELSATGAVATAQSLAPAEYRVVEGDTVGDISARFGLSTASVLARNGLSWKSMIFPGQVLSLGASASPVMPDEVPLTRYTIVAGDTIGAVAARHGVAVDAVLSANGLGRDSIIYPGQAVVIPQLGGSEASAEVELQPVASVAELHSSIGLDSEMHDNAAHIVRIGRELGVDDRGIVIALAAAMQESTLRNLEWGHLDSLGLFQQRPSMGWGTEAEITDPDYSIRAFYLGVRSEEYTNAGLLDIDGWQSMSVAEAAQAVQISAYPDEYAKWESDAWAWLGILG